MSNVNYTPGSWYVGNYPMSSDASPVGIYSDKGMVANTWRSYSPHPLSQAEAEANAKLIAAAPEMLAALQRMVTSMVNSAPHHRDPEALDAAMAALKKATGGAL